MTGQILVSGAGRALMEKTNDPLHDYTLSLTGKDNPRVLFLGTATGDDPFYIVTFYDTYNSEKCRPAHLRLFHITVSELRPFILRHDVIHVGGADGGRDLLRVARERLLAEDVLAGLERADRPLAMERVRQRDVHRICARSGGMALVLRGSEWRDASGDASRDMFRPRRWATALRQSAPSLKDDSYVFFNNHFAGFGPESVNEFRRLLGMIELNWAQDQGQGSNQATLL